nr:hypothetical protein Iba_chr11bCG13160 [Ipomoea batatas]
MEGGANVRSEVSVLDRVTRIEGVKIRRKKGWGKAKRKPYYRSTSQNEERE